MEALGINPGYLIMQILGITILTMLLKGLLTDPITKTLEERKSRIVKGLEDSRQAMIARDNAEAEAKSILDEARAEAGRIRAEAVASAEDSRKSIESEAGEQSRVILAKAESDADERRNSALGDLRGQVAAIAIAAANKIVGESLDEKRQHALIGDFFSKVPENVQSLSGSSAEITSALPLTDAEMESAKKAVNADTVTFKVDPNIMGGLVVKVDDQVVDNSVAGQMSGLRESIN